MGNRKKIFDQHTQAIAEFFAIDEGDMFLRCKKGDNTQPRQWLIYLLNKRGYPLVTIQQYLKQNGLNLSQGTVSWNRDKAERDIRNSEVYKESIRAIRDLLKTNKDKP